MSVILMTAFVSCEKSVNSPYVGSYECMMVNTLPEDCTVDVSENTDGNLSVHVYGYNVCELELNLDDSLNIVYCPTCFCRGDVVSGRLWKEHGKLKMEVKTRPFNSISTMTYSIAEK